MSTSRSLLFFAIAIVAVIAFGAVVHHMRSLCEDEQVIEISNGKYVAVVFHRDCDRSEIVHVNLRKEGSRFGTDFMTGTIEEGEVLSATTVTRPIEAHWAGPNALVVSVPADSIYPSRYLPRNMKTEGRTIIAHMENAWEDVKITYERQP